MMKYTVIFKPRCIRKLWPGTTFQQQTLFTFEGQGLQLLVLVFTLFSEHFVVFHGSTSDYVFKFLFRQYAILGFSSKTCFSYKFLVKSSFYLQFF